MESHGFSHRSVDGLPWAEGRHALSTTTRWTFTPESRQQPEALFAAQASDEAWFRLRRLAEELALRVLMRPGRVGSSRRSPSTFFDGDIFHGDPLDDPAPRV